MAALRGIWAKADEQLAAQNALHHSCRAQNSTQKLAAAVGIMAR